MLRQCPNLCHLDLSHTKVSDFAFKGYADIAGFLQYVLLIVTTYTNTTMVTTYTQCFVWLLTTPFLATLPTIARMVKVVTRLLPPISN